MTRERIQIVGEVLRFVTPALVAIIGWVVITYQSSLDKKFDLIDNKIDYFSIAFHAMDMRIYRLEYSLNKQNKGE